MGFGSVALWKIALTELPKELVEFLKIEFTKPAKFPEHDEDVLKLRIILKVGFRKFGEFVDTAKIHQYLMDVGIVDRVVKRLMVGTVFGGEGIEVLPFASDFVSCDIINEIWVPFLWSIIDIKIQNALGHGIDFEDVRTVEVVEDVAFDQNVAQIIVGPIIVIDPVDCLFLRGIVL